MRGWLQRAIRLWVRPAQGTNSVATEELATALGERSEAAGRLLVLLSPNPMHDTGGGQRSAQLALEFLERGWTVLFVSHGEVTETVDLALHFEHERLVTCALHEAVELAASGWFRRFARPGASSRAPQLLGLFQVPVRDAKPLFDAVRDMGVAVYDCIDAWDSELGWGWYRAKTERVMARRAHVCTASAPMLERRLGALGATEVHALANAFNPRVFSLASGAERPADLPAEGPVVIYVGSLWGSWMDWSLVDAAARACPEYTFVFVGDHRGEGAGLPSNCRFTGLKPQSELPGYLQHATVGWLPWKIDPITQATSPLKVYEYLAMALPVVGPSVEPLEGLPGLDTATNPEGFIDALQQRVNEPIEDGQRRAMREFAERNGWPARVDRLLQVAGIG